MEAGNFADKLIMERSYQGWTQAEMSKELGVSLRSITLWESGEKLPRKTTRIKMAKLFGKDPNYFLAEDELLSVGANANPNDQTGANSYSLELSDTKRVEKELYDALRASVEDSSVAEHIQEECLKAIERILVNEDLR